MDSHPGGRDVLEDVGMQTKPGLIHASGQRSSRTLHGCIVSQRERTRTSPLRIWATRRRPGTS
eukprot:scaffold3870_cov246-Pinguiococcus_pyrenoidosus.AAC.7